MLSTKVRSLLFGFLAFCFVVANIAPAHAAKGTKVRVAVMPFVVNASPDFAYLKESLPELLSDRLAEQGFDVVSQKDVLKTLQSRNVSKVSRKDAQETALLLGAGFAVYGTFNQLGDSLVFDARVADAFGLKVPKKVTASRKGLINLLPAVDDLVKKIKSQLLHQDTISEIAVDGTKILDKEVILMRLTLKKGDLLTGKNINKALKQIYDLGYFDDVKVKVADTSEGKRVTFVVKEKPRIQAIGVRGASAIDAEDIVKAVSSKKGAVANPKVLAGDIKTIRQMYRKEGYYKAKVTHELETADSGQARLNFVIDEGPKLYITKIAIDGAKQVDPDDILDILAHKERGIFSWFTKTGVLKEELLDRDGAAIMAFYSDHGFVNVRVGRPVVEIKDDGIYITYKVWEGDRYKMGKTTFTGDLITDTDKLASVTGVDNLLADEEWFNRSVVREDLKRLTQYYNDYGYAFADVDVKINDDAAKKVVNVVYTITKHQKVRIRRVLVEGNTGTRDNVILREMRLADGDLFSGSKLKRSAQRLDKLGYFEKVDIKPVPTGNPDELDLLVKVKDKPTGRIGGGIGYSTYDSVFLAADITEKNLFGRGYTVGLNGKFSGRETAFTLNFFNPHLNDSNIGWGLELWKRDEDFNDYDKDSIGGRTAFSYPLGEYTSMVGGYTLEWYNIHEVSSTADREILDAKGNHLLSQVDFKLIRDTLNSNMFPTAGYKVVGSMIMGGGALGGTDNFVKWLLTGDYYRKVFGDLTFHAKAHFGLVHENFSDDDIPLTQRFYLGGMNSVRGYSTRKISPISSTSSELIGGNKEFYTNLELLYPLSDEYGIQLVTFFDAGNVWKEGQMFFDQVARNSIAAPTGGLYKSVGTGLRWNSPLGPLRIEYGYGLDKLYDSGSHKIEFSMGQVF